MYALLRPLCSGSSILILTSSLALAGCDNGDSGDGGTTITAIASCTPESGVAPHQIKCTGDFEGVPEDDPVAFEWVFGGGDDAPRKTERNPQHTFQDPGSYDVTLVVTHPASGATGSASVAIDVTGAANLVVTGVTFAPNELSGEGDLTVSFTVQNRGSSPSEPSTAGIKLSRNPGITINSVGKFLGEVEVGGIEPMDEIVVEGTVARVQATTESGAYFVAVCADYYDAVAEPTKPDDLEADNCEKAQGTLEFTRIDQFAELVVSDVTATPQAAIQGGQVDVRFIVENAGERPAGFHDYAICIVPNADPETCRCDLEEAMELRTGRIEAVPSNDQLAETVTLTLAADLPFGPYCLAVEIDVGEQVQELDERNNTTAADVPLVVMEWPVDGVDLLVSRVEVEPMQVSEDGSLLIQTRFWNRGRVRATQHVSAAVLSPERDFEHPDAQILSTWNVAQLRATEDLPATAVAPLVNRFDIGAYFLCVKSDRDNVIRESDESNNTVCHPEPIQVGETQDVDLEVVELSFGPLAEDPHPCGRPLDVAVALRNREPSVADSFIYRIYLSPDEVIERNDFQIWQGEVASLAGEVFREVVQPTIPIDTPEQVERWFLGVFVDPEDLVDETEEDNNRRLAEGTLQLTNCLGGCGDDGFEPNNTVSGAARVSPGLHEGLCIGPDSGDDWFGVPLLAGESMTVGISFQQEHGDLDLELYDASGINLLERSASGASQEAVTVPLATVASLYFVRIKGARLGVENRYSMVLDIREPLQGTDLTPASLAVSPRDVILGQGIDVSLEVVNLGLVAADGFSLDVIATKLGSQATDAEGNPVWDGEGNPVLQEWSLATLALPGAPALGTQPAGLTVVLPPDAGAGEFKLRVEVDLDGVVAELDEDNNAATSLTIVHRVPIDECVAADDEHEPNNTAATAMGPPLAVDPNGGPVTVDDLGVCDGYDDWWSVDLEDGDAFEAEVRFLHRLGDLDLFLHPPEGGRPEESTTRNNKEEVSVCGAEPGTWHVQVHFHGGGGDEPWNNYRMTLGLDRCEVDAVEPNETCDQGVPVGAEGLEDLWLCAGDTDVFKVQLFSGFPVTICAEPRVGDPTDLTVTLLRGCQFVRSLAGCLQYEPRADDTYEVQITAGGCRIRNYDLTIEGLDGADVAVTDLALEPDEVVAGMRPQVTGTIRNTLVLPVGPFDYELRLSDDDEIDDGDVLLKTWRRVDPLDRGGRIDIDTKIDIPEDAEAGQHHVGLRIVPDVGVADRSPANNVRSVPLTLVEPCGSDARDPDDDLEPGSPTLAGEYEGTLCRGDEDWYAVDLVDGQSLTATLRFVHADGDLDLWAYGWDGAVSALLQRSEGSGDRETVELAEPGAGTYLVRVVAGGRDVENAYTLEVETAP